MTVDALLQEVMTGVEKDKAAKQAKWRTVVRAVATGQKVKPGDVSDLLTQLGKTPDEFMAAVKLDSRRLELAAKIADEPEHHKVIQKSQRELEKLKVQFEEQERVYRQACWPHQADIERSTRAIGESGSARSELYQTCPYPEQKARLQELNREASGVSKALRAAQETVERRTAELRIACKGRVRAAVDQGAISLQDASRRHGHETATESELAWLDLAKAEVARLQAESDRLEAERVKVEDAMRQP